jgi:hypothetical protein
MVWITRPSNLVFMQSNISHPDFGFSRIANHNQKGWIIPRENIPFVVHEFFHERDNKPHLKFLH